MTCYLFLMLFQLYLYCYRGNEIIIHSHNITDEIFGSSWFLADVSTQKLLLTMMTRACRPIRMTAGKFVYLSLEAFMSVSENNRKRNSINQANENLIILQTKVIESFNCLNFLLPLLNFLAVFRGTEGQPQYGPFTP